MFPSDVTALELLGITADETADDLVGVTILPSLPTVQPDSSAKGPSFSPSRSPSGMRSALPRRSPLSDKMLPFLSHILPTIFLGSPSTTLPKIWPLLSTMLPNLLTRLPARMERSTSGSGSASGSGSSSQGAAVPTTLPLRSRMSPSWSTFIPRRRLISPSDTLPTRSPSKTTKPSRSTVASGRA
jgi:hypothetical protein